MKVKLIRWTPDPEVLIAAAARLCYRDISAEEILEDMDENSAEVERMFSILIPSGHLSVLEHVTFTFAIDDVSRVLTHQLVRHRVGIAYSQQSQRYAKLTQGETDHVVPASIIRNIDLWEEYEQLWVQTMEFYERAVANGIPKEDARYVLMQAIHTRMVLTVNARELIHMFAINACFRSQWEFRKLMVLMRDEVQKVSPRIAEEMKIKCYVSGYCDEFYQCEQLKGKMPKREDFLSKK